MIILNQQKYQKYKQNYDKQISNFAEFIKEVITRHSFPVIVILAIVILFLVIIKLPANIGNSITALFTALSAVFVGIQARDSRKSDKVFRQRDKNKMTIKVISNFDDLVVSEVRDAINEDKPNEMAKDLYSAIKSFVMIYSAIDSGLANNFLVTKYINHDLKYVANNLSGVITEFDKRSRLSYYTDKYLKIMENEYGFKKSELISED